MAKFIKLSGAHTLPSLTNKQVLVCVSRQPWGLGYPSSHNSLIAISVGVGAGLGVGVGYVWSKYDLGQK